MNPEVLIEVMATALRKALEGNTAVATIALSEYDRFKATTGKPTLQPRQFVLVDNEQYHGPGLVLDDVGFRPRRVQVLLENGNAWWYDVETVTPADISDNPVLNLCMGCVKHQTSLCASISRSALGVRCGSFAAKVVAK